MAHVVPSDAVKLIDRRFPFAVDPDKNPVLDGGHLKSLAALLEVIDKIPNELLPLGSEDLTTLTEMQASIRIFFDEVHAHGTNAKGLSGVHISSIRAILAKCPDYS